MAYFTCPMACAHYVPEWTDLQNYIKTDWPPEQAAHLGDLQHHLEAKALCIISMATRLMIAATQLSKPSGWKLIFIEATTLLFPMIELIGAARLGKAPVTSDWRSLACGIDWLLDPEFLTTKSRQPFPGEDTTRVSTLGPHMNSLPSGPTVQELYHLRNYLVHGLKSIRSPNFSIGSLQTSMNYELPRAIIAQAGVGLKIYWRQLSNSDGKENQDWINRLAEADIYPFCIKGSNLFEKGFIEPEIVYSLQ